jgi:hypothetical protein
MPDSLDGLQLILGTDKRNPAFCLYTDAAEQALHVYYGLELLEVVPNDRASPAFRLLAARLYNAGLRVATLVALFGLDPKTLRTWGRALRSGDRDWLARVLDGRWGRRKLTPALESYVRYRWPLLRAQGVRDFRQRLRTELARVFGVKVAGETLRPLLRQLRAAEGSGPNPKPEVAPAESGPAADPSATETNSARAPAGPAPACLGATHEPPTLLTPLLPLAFTPLAETSSASAVTSLPAPAPVPVPTAAAERTVAPGAAGTPTPDPAVALPAAPPTSSPVVPSATPPSLAEVTAVSTPLPASIVPTAAAELALASSAAGTPTPDPAVAILVAPPAPSPAVPSTTPPSLAEVTAVSPPLPAFVLPAARQSLPFWEDWSVGQTVWCEHAGILLFADALRTVSDAVTPPQPWLRQALGSVLAGALNVEQTKHLNAADLTALLGPQVPGLGAQRRQLKALADGPTADALLRWNAQRLGAAAQTDFYFDPHTKHYTGMAAVLKGWCATLRWADKALHSDFLHSPTGQPLYFECTDNYADLRVRLLDVLARARTALGWPPERILTVVIDRAVFGQETFEKILAEPALHLITWQKGYRPGDWDETQVSGQCVLERTRNCAADRQTCHFRYRDQKWAADPRWRQLIVQATHPNGRTVEVAILTDDHERPAAQIVRLMFGRWVQENDFKYLDQHFGINQITSYGVISYAELKSQLTDRQIQSGTARALLEQARQLRAQLGRRLWSQRDAEPRHTAAQARRAELESQLAPAPAPPPPRAPPRPAPRPSRPRSPRPPRRPRPPAAN